MNDCRGGEAARSVREAVVDVVADALVRAAVGAEPAVGAFLAIGVVAPEAAISVTAPPTAAAFLAEDQPCQPKAKRTRDQPVANIPVTVALLVGNVLQLGNTVAMLVGNVPQLGVRSLPACSPWSPLSIG